ncbi:MAG: DNA translocase FtsK 4TM domain-containing protein [Syntrophobacterales bacterium]|nr:DNA translocase FtsK 4TM domain-containing protein [Syntrophobacterales bacterium]
MNSDSPFSKRWAEIAGLVCIACALFLFITLLSYYPLDPSLRHFYGPEEIAVRNWAGTVGAYAADAAIWLIGFGILWLPVALMFFAVRFLQIPQFSIGIDAVSAVIGLIFATSGILEMTAGDISFYGNSVDTGGLLGSRTYELFKLSLHPAGSAILFFLVFLVALIVLFDFSFVAFVKKSAASLLNLKNAGAFFFLLKGKLWGDGEKAARADSKTDPRIAEIKSEKIKEKLAKAEQTHLDFTAPGKSSGKYKLPPLTLLEQLQKKDTRVKKETLLENSRLLEKKLFDFGVEGRVIEVKPGPVVTMYELEPAPGVKINKITNLSDDLALALRAQSIRIIAPIPGKGAIGVEIPNQERNPVSLRDVLDHPAFQGSTYKLPIALGEDILGTPVIADLLRMPHLMIAGTTGSGKSVSLNAMICSILFKASPEEVKFIMIDPKRLEMSGYEGIPHLLHPVVVDPKKASLVLRWAVEEMERRYQAISEVGAKSIDTYNLMQTTKQPAAKPSNMDAEGEGKGAEKKDSLPEQLPYIVIIIDELADLMMVAQRNVEESLARLAQMARAAGIHIILATQRPSVDVITGVIKANFPTRISFKVSSKVDSRTILDQLGAEKLLGAGDMLFIPPGSSVPMRIHGAYVSDQEIERIVDFVKQQGKPAYDESLVELKSVEAEEKAEGEFDEKYDEAVELVTKQGQASISLVQRYLKIGYNRAAGIIEKMEAEGVVGPADGAKPRKVLARKLP